MQDSQLATISNFIWNTADSILRDLYVRGKYRDVILPMTVIRRLDAVLPYLQRGVYGYSQHIREFRIRQR